VRRVQVLAGLNEPAARPSRRNCAGVIEQSSLAYDRGRQGCFHVGGAQIEICRWQAHNVSSRAHTPESALDARPVRALRRAVRQH
jgi:hypothetical protein